MTSRIHAPSAPQRTHIITQHGQTRVDNFFWLRERESKDVIAYLEAENAYTDKTLAATASLQEALFQEMKGRMMEDDVTVPEFFGDRRFSYYARREAGMQYDIHCRRPSDGGDETVLLDENVMAAEHSYFKLGVFKPSPDHRYVAFRWTLPGMRSMRSGFET